MQAASASVLTVEDDPIVRADLRLVLEDAGFTVVAGARDGVEAVELARAHRPDVIVLDLGLPRLDGVEATNLILAERSVPIVAMTGRSSSLSEAAIDAGAASYLLKPFGRAQVVSAVHDALFAHRVAEVRTTSRLAVKRMLELLGYPPEWAVELEERAWRQHRIWRIRR